MGGKNGLNFSLCVIFMLITDRTKLLSYKYYNKLSPRSDLVDSLTDKATGCPLAVQLKLLELWSDTGQSDWVSLLRKKLVHKVIE